MVILPVTPFLSAQAIHSLRFFKPDKDIFPGKFPAMQHHFHPVIFPHQGIEHSGIGDLHFSGPIIPFRDNASKINIIEGMIFHGDCQPPFSLVFPVTLLAPPSSSGHRPAQAGNQNDGAGRNARGVQTASGEFLS